MTVALTRALGEFAAALRPEDVPREARDTIRLGFTDCIAVMYAGANEPGVELLRGQLQTRGLVSEASLCGGAERASASDAALLNGMAGHVLDYDDIALGGHPSVVLVPAILAQAEALGLAGLAAITAYAAGFEAWARIIERDKDQYHQKGWHPTSVVGPVAAAAAIANLRGLDAGRATHAVGIAASLSSGLVSNFGSMTKSFQVGWAASSGVIAAKLAAAGFTASEAAIEDPVGLLTALSQNGRIDRDTPADDLGREWRILKRGLMIKRYPMCGASHRCIDALLDLRALHGLTPDNVAVIDTRIGRTQSTVLRNHRPCTVTEARFSMEFALAAAIRAGKVGLTEFTDAFVSRPDVQAEMGKIRISPVDEQAEDEPIFAPFDVVTVTTTDGRRLQSPEIRHPRGHWSEPLTNEELWDKFADCTAALLPPDAQRALFSDLQSLETMRDLSGLLRAPAPDEVDRRPCSKLASLGG